MLLQCVLVNALPQPERQPARYSGTVNGNTMTLQVRLTATARDLGTFNLTRGSSGRVFKCL
jgi:hypothetical protein